MSKRIVMIDNYDSFVYNLVDAVSHHDVTVFRNTVAVDTVLEADPELIVLSPGPGHPRDAGTMMSLLDAAITRSIPVLGICLGFQAMLEHFGGVVAPCGPVHGMTDSMRVTPAGRESGLFAGDSVPVARYHSLGCLAAPAEMTTLALADSDAGEIVMAASAPGLIGLQFHPESVLSPTGPIILDNAISQLTQER